MTCCYIEPIPSFWGITVEPKKNSKIKILDGYYTILTNVCFGDLPEKFEKKSNILEAQIESIQIENMDPKSRDAPIKKEKINLCSLIPGEVEHLTINYIFSSLDQVNLKVMGDIPIHVSGKYVPIEDIEEEEEEEMEEEEILELTKEEESKILSKCEKFN